MRQCKNRGACAAGTPSWTWGPTTATSGTSLMELGRSAQRLYTFKVSKEMSSFYLGLDVFCLFELEPRMCFASDSYDSSLIISRKHWASKQRQQHFADLTINNLWVCPSFKVKVCGNQVVARLKDRGAWNMSYLVWQFC
jgi:hypothetical protein